MQNDLKKLDHDQLHEQTIEAAKVEKNATMKLLEYLSEVDRRKLYAMRGFSSLWVYVHQALGYSEAQASERISAMRLMVRVPEVREEIESNRITLTAVAKLASHVRRERNNESETIELLNSIQGKSTREVERILASQASEPVRMESVRPISAETTRILMDVDQEFLLLLNQVRELQGHFGSSTSELIQTAMKGFVKMHPKRRLVGRVNTNVNLQNPHGDSVNKRLQSEAVSYTKVELKRSTLRAPKVQSETISLVDAGDKTETGFKPSRAIPVAIQRAVRARSGHKCEYVDSQTQKRCDSRIQLQFDHRVPFAMGGLHTVENLRHLCRAHNQLEAVRFFGVKHMRPFLRN